MPPQFKAEKLAVARRLRKWIWRATISLPVPVSPWISTFSLLREGQHDQPADVFRRLRITQVGCAQAVWNFFRRALFEEELPITISPGWLTRWQIGLIQRQGPGPDLLEQRLGNANQADTGGLLRRGPEQQRTDAALRLARIGVASPDRHYPGPVGKVHGQRPRRVLLAPVED